MKKDFEENIVNEVEEILREIYSSHLQKKNYDFKKYENYINKTQKEKQDYLHFIIKTLEFKISEHIKVIIIVFYIFRLEI